MHRPNRAHRLILLHTLLVFPIVAGIFGVFLHLHHARVLSLTHTQLMNLQQVITRTAKEIPSDRVTECISRILPPANKASGTLFWIGSKGEIRWASRTPPAGKTLRALLPETLLKNGLLPLPAIRLNAPPSSEFHYEQIDPLDPEKGGILLYEPRSRHTFIYQDLALYTVLFILFIGASYLFYRYLFRKQIQSVIDASGLPNLIPVPEPGQGINAWARQYAARASQMIAESRDQFDSLFEILQDGILLIDKDNCIRRANTAAAEMLGGSPQTLIGHPLSELEDGSLLISFLVDVRSNTSCQSTELFLDNENNQISAAGLRIQAGGEPGLDSPIILILRDLTRLRQLERAGEEYAVNVSHELKTPLTLIQGFTETLLAHEDMDAESRMRALRTIERHAKRISRIIDDLLRLAWLKNEDYSVGIPRTETSISGIIGETVFMCDEWARNAGIAIKTDYPEDLVWSLNTGLMEEALINLVKNAILYAIVGPVEIRACVTPKGNLELSVVDRGPGLKPQDAQHIFDRFYRVDKSRARASGGSGLGLPIVQQIVEAHHGRARVETAPGEGCTFILEIPPKN